MNDDLFDFLAATDELDEFLGCEPKCPNCGSKLAKIFYGMPTSKDIKREEKGEIHIVGCCPEDNEMKFYCNNCKRSYSKDLKRNLDRKR